MTLSALALDHRTRVWRDGSLFAEGLTVDEAAKHLDEPQCVVWIGLNPEQGDQLNLLGKRLGFGPHAIEDAGSGIERTKLDRYQNAFFMNVYATRLDGDADDTVLTKTFVSGLVTARAMVTVTAHDSNVDLDDLARRWDSEPGETRLGAAYLAHGLLDQVVDGQFGAALALAQQLDDLEDEVFNSNGDQESQERTFNLRRNVLRLQHLAQPTRDVVGSLLHGGLDIVPRALASHLRDVHDHAQSTVEISTSSRELLATILETRIALQGNRMNEVMKKVTSWAAIIAVPTAVTSLYGMNVIYPGTNTTWGFAVSLVIIAVSSLSLYAVFKRNQWL